MTETKKLDAQTKGSVADAKSVDEAKYAQYVGMVKACGHSLDETPGNVNVIGIQGWVDGQVVENVKNQYNDSIVVVYIDKKTGEKKCEEFLASVDPGSFSQDKVKARGGSANLTYGQHTYKLGTHKGYAAFNPVNKTTVWRDKNNDGKRDEGDNEQTGNYGINIHAGGSMNRGVNGWSEGCQVIAAKASGVTGDNVATKNAEFIKFRDTIVNNDDDKQFVYTLISGNLAKERYDEQQAKAQAPAAPAVEASDDSSWKGVPYANPTSSYPMGADYWSQFGQGKDYGYLWRNDTYLNANKTADAAKTAAPAPAAKTPLGVGRVATKSGGALNVRAGAGTEHDALGTLKNNEDFTYYAESNGWLQISFKGKEGWISKKYTTIGGGSAASSTTSSSTSSNASSNSSSASSNKSYANFEELAGAAYDDEIRSEGKFDQIFFDLNDRNKLQKGVINLGSGSAMGFGQYTKGVGGIDVCVGSSQTEGVKLHFKSDVALNEAIAGAFGSDYTKPMEAYQAVAFKKGSTKQERSAAYKTAISTLKAIGGRMITDSNGKTASVCFTGTMGYVNVFLSATDVAEIRKINFNTDAGYSEAVQKVFVENTKSPQNVILKDFIHMVHAASGMKSVINTFGKDQANLDILAKAVASNTVTDALCTALYKTIKYSYPKAAKALAGAVVRQLEKAASAASSAWEPIAEARLAAV